PEGHPRDDLLDARHLRVEPVDEGVVEPDESVPGVDRQPDDEIEVAAAGTVAVAAAPARHEPKRPGLLELESRGRVVGRVIAVAVLGPDRELDSAFAHQLVAAPDPRQRAAAAPVALNLEYAVSIEHVDGPFLRNDARGKWQTHRQRKRGARGPARLAGQERDALLPRRASGFRWRALRRGNAGDGSHRGSGLNELPSIHVAAL